MIIRSQILRLSNRFNSTKEQLYYISIKGLENIAMERYTKKTSQNLDVDTDETKITLDPAHVLLHVYEVVKSRNPEKAVSIKSYIKNNRDIIVHLMSLVLKNLVVDTMGFFNTGGLPLADLLCVIRWQ